MSASNEVASTARQVYACQPFPVFSSERYKSQRKLLTIKPVTRISARDVWLTYAFALNMLRYWDKPSRHRRP